MAAVYVRLRENTFPGRWKGPRCRAVSFSFLGKPAEHLTADGAFWEGTLPGRLCDWVGPRKCQQP